jgi:ABC-type transporter Mla subunit MlaD
MFLLAVLVFMFGRMPATFTTQDRYYITFDHAPGVAPGTPVRRSGVRIGQVQNIDLDDATGQVRVTILIEHPHRLYEGDIPVLVSGALSGDTTIDFVAPPPETPATPAAPKQPPPPAKSAIVPVSHEDNPAVPGEDPKRADEELAQLPAGKAQALQPQQRVPVEPGTEFKGMSQGDVSTLIRELSKLTPPAQDAFLEMQKALVTFEKMAPLFEETTREFRDLSKTTRELMPDLRKTNDEILVATRNWGKVGERVDLFIQTNQDKVVRSIDSLNDTLNRVGGVLNDENVRNLSSTLKNVNAGTKNLESLSRNTEEFLQESRQTVRHINDSLTTTDTLLLDLQKTLRPFADRSESLTRNLDESAVRLNKTLTEAEDLLKHVSQADGTLRRFVDDPSLYNNLNDAACLLTRTLPRVDRILKDFEVFADKVARHPESLGVRGAIAPSSGLKESPWRSTYVPQPDH